MLAYLESNSTSSQPTNPDQEDRMFHQSFEENDLKDRLSSYKSTVSRQSNQKSLILKNMTPFSKSVYIRSQKHSDPNNSETQSCRFKSTTPHVTLKSARFESLENGWLFKKFDTNSSNKALLNNFSELSLLSYDTDKLEFRYKPEMLKKLNDFFSAVSLFGDFKANLFACSCFSNKSIRLEDLEKEKNISVTKSDLESQITTLKAGVNLLDFGTCEGVVGFVDTRSGKKCFEKTINGAGEFNAVLNLDRHDNMLLWAARQSVGVLDIRKIGGEFVLDVSNVSQSNGVNRALFLPRKQGLAVAVCQVGTKSVRIFDIKRGQFESEVLRTKRKILGMTVNPEDGEIACLEGSEIMGVGFYGIQNLEERDRIGMPEDMLEVRFNSSGDCLVAFGTKACQVYCFENEQLMKMAESTICFD